MSHCALDGRNAARQTCALLLSFLCPRRSAHPEHPVLSAHRAGDDSERLSSVPSQATTGCPGCSGNPRPRWATPSSGQLWLVDFSLWGHASPASQLPPFQSVLDHVVVIRLPAVGAVAARMPALPTTLQLTVCTACVVCCVSCLTRVVSTAPAILRAIHRRR